MDRRSRRHMFTAFAHRAGLGNVLIKLQRESCAPWASYVMSLSTSLEKMNSRCCLWHSLERVRDGACDGKSRYGLAETLETFLERVAES